MAHSYYFYAMRYIFSGAAYTKGDVADYYRSVARWLLPELAGRPLSLLRCPDGSQGECFFQKHHADSLGDDVHAIGLKQKSGRVQYLYVDDIEGVIRSEEHTSELQSLMRISYAVFCLKK